MNDMQWALLVIGVVVVLGVYLHARRQAAKQAVWNNKRKREGQEEDQLDFFKDDSEGFDEFGVGKARSPRLAPSVGAEAPAVKPTSAGKSTGSAPPNLFVLSVHRSDLSLVDPDMLHQVLQSCGLEFGTHDIYHRFSPKGDPVFSVASMVKPGFLIPSEKDELNTPGVSMFLQLPGPVAGSVAFEDMLATALTLVEQLDGTMLDRNRQPLTDDGLAQMREACALFQAQ